MRLTICSLVLMISGLVLSITLSLGDAAWSQSVESTNDCSILLDSKERESCWKISENFDCGKLGDADEQLKCSVYHAGKPVSSPDPQVETVPWPSDALPNGFNANFQGSEWYTGRSAVGVVPFAQSNYYYAPSTVWGTSPDNWIYGGYPGYFNQN